MFLTMVCKQPGESLETLIRRALVLGELSPGLAAAINRYLMSRLGSVSADSPPDSLKSQPQAHDSLSRRVSSANSQQPSAGSASQAEPDSGSETNPLATEASTLNALIETSDLNCDNSSRLSSKDHRMLAILKDAIADGLVKLIY